MLNGAVRVAQVGSPPRNRTRVVVRGRTQARRVPFRQAWAPISEELATPGIETLEHVSPTGAGIAAERRSGPATPSALRASRERPRLRVGARR